MKSTSLPDQMATDEVDEVVLNLTRKKVRGPTEKRVDLDECALAVLKHTRPLALMYAGMIVTLVSARLLQDASAVASAVLLLVPFVVGLSRPRVPRDYKLRRWAATFEVFFSAALCSRYGIMNIFAFKAPRIWELPLLVTAIMLISTLAISVGIFIYCGLPVKKTHSLRSLNDETRN